MFKQDFTSKQVCELTGLTYRQLDHWTSTGLIEADINKGTGSGGRRAYSFNELIIVYMIKNLLNVGMKIENMRKFVKCFEQSQHTRMVAFNETQIWCFANKKMLQEILREEDVTALIIVNMARLVEELKLKIEYKEKTPPDVPNGVCNYSIAYGK